jgi:hypothetical protein
VISLGQVQQPPLGNRVRFLGQIARPLREAFVELFHDATPATSLKAEFQYRAGERSRAEEIAENFPRHCCAGAMRRPKLQAVGENPMAVLYWSRKRCPTCGKPMMAVPDDAATDRQRYACDGGPLRSPRLRGWIEGPLRPPADC